MSYFHSVLRGARNRNIIFDINIEYLDSLIIKQNFKCALTGLNIVSGYGQKTASLDRIDSKKGYIQDNVQWVHKNINWMKRAFSQEEFINYCRLVTEKNNGFKSSSSHQ